MAADFEGSFGPVAPFGVVLEPILRGNVCDLLNTAKLAGRLLVINSFRPDAVDRKRKTTVKNQSESFGKSKRVLVSKQ